MVEFKVGDHVKVKQNIQYLGSWEDNMSFLVGIIVRIDEDGDGSPYLEIKLDKIPPFMETHRSEHYLWLPGSDVELVPDSGLPPLEILERTPSLAAQVRAQEKLVSLHKCNRTESGFIVTRVAHCLGNKDYQSAVEHLTNFIGDGKLYSVFQVLSTLVGENHG